MAHALKNYLVLLFLAFPLLAFADKRDNKDAEYLLSLGTSLSVGIQPVLAGPNAGQNQPTNEGYPDQLFNILAADDDDLALVKLGCPGETTQSFIAGGKCEYKKRSQLAQAVKFLKKHGDDVKYVTIDLGVNDILASGCITGSGGATVIDVNCIFAGPFADIPTNLGYILQTLQAAADEDTQFVAMNYYNTFLALWLTGPSGQVLAGQSSLLASIFNIDVLGLTYAAFGVPVADVAQAFQSDNTTLVEFPPPFGIAPLNVAAICELTWMCAPAPIGPNIHANVAGYGVIAATLAAEIDQLGNDDDDDDEDDDEDDDD